MKKIYLLLSLLVALQGISQTISITNNPGTSGNVVIGANTYHASEAIFLASEIGAGNFESAPTAMTSIAFSLNQANTTATLPVTVPNFQVYLKDVPSGTTTMATGTYDLAGYTQVFNGTYTLSNYGWNPLTLTTPYVRTAGSNLQVLIVRNNGAAIAGTVFDCATGNTAIDGNALTSRRYNGAIAPAANSTTLTATNFRFAIQLKRAVANDVSIENIYPLGVNGRGVANLVRAYITNFGTTARTNLLVSLNVTGANTFSTSVTIPSLPAGSSGFITFPTYISNNVGTNTVTVSVPADDITTNDSRSASQDITTNKINYAIGTTATAGVNAGSGNEVAAKFAVPYPNSLSAVDLYFSGAGNTFEVDIYANAGGIPGALLANIPGQTSAVGLNTILLPTPVAVSDSFYVGIKQTGAALLLSYQTETPPRSNAYFLKSGASAWFDLAGNPANSFRMMVGVTTAAALPVKTTNFVGRMNGDNALLTWNTATEINNAGFEIERSMNGKDFSKVGFVAGVNNASNGQSYQFVDSKVASGSNYYRLKQVDVDGRFEYSGVIKLSKLSKKNFEVTVINPSKDKVLLQVNSETTEKVAIQLFNVNGQVVASVNTTISAGANSLSVGQNLSKGSYIVAINRGGDISSYKVIVD